MLLRPSTLFSLSAVFLALCQASVPSDLSSGFDPNSISLQVSFTGNAEEGFADGSSISSKEASTTPTFALGDSSGINTAVSFVIMMVDTTESQLTLHYLQTGFKSDGDETGISSTTSPSLEYQPPGSFGETGTRNYVFLLYGQTSGSISGLPSKGSSFDISSFQKANGLQAPEAGISMSVDVGGSGSSNSNNQPQQSSAQASSTQQANTAQQTTFQSSAANTVSPTAAASVGAAGSGQASGVTSSSPTSVSGTAITEPTGSAGAASGASGSSKPTGAAVPLRVGRREVLAGLGAVAMGVLL